MPVVPSAHPVRLILCYGGNNPALVVSKLYKDAPLRRFGGRHVQPCTIADVGP
jgi:hypothetical protein